jgi:hypothetical protein
VKKNGEEKTLVGKEQAMGCWSLLTRYGKNEEFRDVSKEALIYKYED